MFIKLFCILFAILGLAIILASCAPKKPVFYPNEKLENAGKDQATVDVQECIDLASGSGLKNNRTKEVATSAARDAAFGAAVGGAVGAVRGDFGEGVAIGAAGGGASGFMRGLFNSREPDPLQKSFVNQCLAEKGYKVIGWK